MGRVLKSVLNGVAVVFIVGAFFLSAIGVFDEKDEGVHDHFGDLNLLALEESGDLLFHI